jgi:hypothetical protein
MARPELDRAGDGLYALPLDEFVAARNELAKRLRKEGDKEGAAEVAALRKPTLVAWAVDQLAHTRRREVDLLLDAGKRLVDAQQASIRKGSRTELDAAQASLRKSVGGLTDAAAEILGPRASASTLARISETLRAAATTAEGRELLARGCLVEELSDTGWDIVAMLTPGPRRERSPARGAQPKPKPPAETQTEAESERQRARLAELERARATAEKRVAAARRKEAAAAERLGDAEAARRAAEDELAEVEREIQALG